MNIHQDKILILDFGSQVTQLIARRIREINVYCEIHSYDVSDEFIREFMPKGIILSGGPNSVYGENTLVAPDIIFKLGVPIFGICYGMQAIASQLGGRVENSGTREFGYAEIYDLKSQLFAGLSDGINKNGNFLQVWMSHGDKVAELPPGFEVVATTASCPIAAMANLEKQIYAVQFHPEVTHTKKGTQILEHFVLEICGSTPAWTILCKGTGRFQRKVARARRRKDNFPGSSSDYQKVRSGFKQPKLPQALVRLNGDEPSPPRYGFPEAQV